MIESSSDHLPQEFTELVQRVLDKEPTLEDLAALNRILPQDPKALRYFVKMSMLNNSTMDRLGAEELENSTIPEASSTTRKPVADLLSKLFSNSWVRRVALAAAAVALSLLLVPGIYHRITSTDVYRVVATSETSEYERGSWIKTYRAYQLEKGSIQIDSPDGNQLTIQGPAAFSLGASNQFTITKGKVWANLDGPPLDLQTRHGLVRDMGTRFGIDQSSAERTRMDVLEGEIQLTSTSGETATAAKGRALISKSGKWPPEETGADASLYTTNHQQAIGIVFSDSWSDIRRIASERPMDTRWTVGEAYKGRKFLDQSPVAITWSAGKTLGTYGQSGSAVAALFHTHLGGRRGERELDDALALGFTDVEGSGINLKIENLDSWLGQIGAKGYRVEVLRNSAMRNFRFAPIAASISEGSAPLEVVETMPGDILSPNYPESAGRNPGGRAITCFRSVFTSRTLFLTAPVTGERRSLDRANISAVRIVPVY
ncbi:hypothetical protein [Luteolibacter sp. AS25]|uniref:hypothetical protein n=1 Tax=Luteolibacter sp. AS25 TaxID=3135776 RepID=UPI00398AC89C